MPLSLTFAREAVKANAAASVDPVLTDGEIETLLTATLPATPWAAGAVVGYGTLIAPTVRVGHWYRAISAGTTGTVEPPWPLVARATVGDGTVTWQEAGPDAAEVYDLRAATYGAWKLKLAKASGYFRFGNEGQSFQQQEVVENILKNLKLWAPVGIN